MGAQPAPAAGMTSRPHRARTLMIQGTASHVGKSVLAAALCRLFVRRGWRVAPFKAQNMSNNSFVTPDGKEIGRAQAMQAEACRIPSRVAFNPILIKPGDDRSAQVVVNGVPEGELLAGDFGMIRRRYASLVREAFEELAHAYDLVILEGAGSPAEINLREYDLVNMAMAREARAPVLLIGDIDRGGAFASLYGTYALLDPEDQRHVKGVVINKFRGDSSLLEPGIRQLEHRTGLPCCGVVPYWEFMRLPEEDSVGWDHRWLNRPRVKGRESSDAHEIPKLRIGIVGLPFISNSTDLDALAEEPDVELVRIDEDTHDPLDAVILPGTKNTPTSARFVQARGIDQVLQRVMRSKGTVVGLCGGFQILGRMIRDPYGVESSIRTTPGLGILDSVTTLARDKVTSQVSGIHRESGHPITGYEVHMGRTEISGARYASLFDVRSPMDTTPRSEGVEADEGRVLGTYIHGVFDSHGFRRFFLNRLRLRNGWTPLKIKESITLDAAIDRLADFVEAHLDLSAIEAMINKGV